MIDVCDSTLGLMLSALIFRLFTSRPVQGNRIIRAVRSHQLTEVRFEKQLMNGM